MQLKSTVIAVSAALALLSMSGNAYASCTAHSVVVVSRPADRMLAIGRWQARVAIGSATYTPTGATRGANN